MFEGWEPLLFSFISERRAVPVYGLAGGESGERGWKRREGGFKTVNLGPRSMFTLQPGERFIVQHTRRGRVGETRG